MDDVFSAEAQLRSLGDYLERILLSGAPVAGEEHQLTLIQCRALAEALATRTAAPRNERLGPGLMGQMVDACRSELAPLKLRIDHAKAWSAKRLVPFEIGEDEMVLRWLLSTIVRYFDGLEPEFSALPAHQLNRVVREVRLMQVWDVVDTEYQRGLRLAIRNLEKAILAAVYAPRN